MNRLLILLILFGSQIGLSDFLLLPVHAARSGELSFLLLYAVFKLVIVLPLLHAELVAGRYQGVSPVELATERRGRPWARVLLVCLLTAVLCVLAINLYNASWTLAVGWDGLTGKLAGFDRLDRVLYWYELGLQNERLMALVVLQVLLLGAVAIFAWTGIALVYALVIPLCIVLMLVQLPDVAVLLREWAWHPIGVNEIIQALQYALTSSMAGFMVWYLIGSRLPLSLPTGRWVLAVQLFDLCLGLVIVATLHAGLAATDITGAEAGVVLQALVAQLAQSEGLTPTWAAFVAVGSVVGALGSLPLLLHFSLVHTGRSSRRWLIGGLALALALALLLQLSARVEPRLTWYGLPLTEVFSRFAFSLVAPAMALLTTLWVGWGLSPNQVLKQVNPRTGGRYLAWRLAVKVLIPVAVALVFVRATLGFGGASPPQVLAVAILLLLLWRLLDWLRQQSVYPRF